MHQGMRKQNNTAEKSAVLFFLFLLFISLIKSFAIICFPSVPSIGRGLKRTPFVRHLKPALEERSKKPYAACIN
jgi:hypothetical protein